MTKNMSGTDGKYQGGFVKNEETVMTIAREDRRR